MLEEAIETAIQIGHSNIGYDVSKCNQINFTAIGLIVNLFKKCPSNNGTVFLLSSSPKIKESSFQQNYHL